MEQKRPPRGGLFFISSTTLICCQKSQDVVPNERASDGTYFGVFPIRGSKFGAADCGFSQQIKRCLCDQMGLQYALWGC